jgi:TolB-like protein
MNRSLVVAAALAAVAPLVVTAAPAGRQKIAVLDIRAVQGVAPGTATILTAIVVDDVAKGGEYEVISQGDVSAMLGFEKQKKILGCNEDTGCLAEIGGALGVDFVLTGQVGQIGSRHHLSFQILDARKARVVSRAARFAERNEDELANAAQKCVADLLAAARGKPVAQAAKEPAAAPAMAPAADLAARPAPEVDAPMRSAPAPAAVRPSRTAAWVTLGAGAVLLAGGAAFGMKAKGDRDDLAKAWAQPNYGATYDSKSKSAKDAALLSNVCWGAGAVATAASGWLFWRSRAPSVAIAPAVTDDGRLALVAGGSF